MAEEQAGKTILQKFIEFCLKHELLIMSVFAGALRWVEFVSSDADISAYDQPAEQRHKVHEYVAYSMVTLQIAILLCELTYKLTASKRGSSELVVEDKRDQRENLEFLTSFITCIALAFEFQYISSVYMAASESPSEDFHDAHKALGYNFMHLFTSALLCRARIIPALTQKVHQVGTGAAEDQEATKEIMNSPDMTFHLGVETQVVFAFLSMWEAANIVKSHGADISVDLLGQERGESFYPAIMYMFIMSLSSIAHGVNLLLKNAGCGILNETLIPKFELPLQLVLFPLLCVQLSYLEQRIQDSEISPVNEPQELYDLIGSYEAYRFLAIIGIIFSTAPAASALIYAGRKAAIFSYEQYMRRGSSVTPSVAVERIRLLRGQSPSRYDTPDPDRTSVIAITDLNYIHNFLRLNEDKNKETADYIANYFKYNSSLEKSINELTSALNNHNINTEVDQRLKHKFTNMINTSKKMKNTFESHISAIADKMLKTSMEGRGYGKQALEVYVSLLLQYNSNIVEYCEQQMQSRSVEYIINEAISEFANKIARELLKLNLPCRIPSQTEEDSDIASSSFSTPNP